MSDLLVTVFNGRVPAELVAAPADRPAVLVAWQVEPGPDGPTLRFDLACTDHAQTPTNDRRLAGVLHTLAHALQGTTFPTGMEVPP